MSLKLDIEVRRVYDHEHHGDDEYLVLVDRLWPRGVAKADLHLDEWAKDVAPSTELRKWYGHEVDRFAEFVARYTAELTQEPAQQHVEQLLERGANGPVVLLTATKDVEHSGAVVLHDYLLELARQ